jgi:lysylphosphatidylglycerol synthetase-like protein (DUF2156 family)
MPNIRRVFDGLMDRRLTQIPKQSATAHQRLELCREHGDFAIAYSTAVQADLRYFGDECGYVAYATKMGYTFVLGDPVAGKQERARYIRDFVLAAANPCFVQIGRETATILSELGYRVNHMGVDTHLPFATHSFAGKRNETVRYSERWLVKQGYSIVECDGTKTQSDQIKAISDNWRAGRIVSRREMRFLNRPFFPDLSPYMRRFLILDPKGNPIALLDFDPMFEGGVVKGYTAAFKRKIAGTTPHAEIGLTKFAADRFRAEGHACVTLGLSPLAAIAESGFSESRLWRALFERAFHSDKVNHHIFNLRGQAAFKRRFHGEEVPTYIAFKRNSPMQMIALLRLLKTL